MRNFVGNNDETSSLSIATTAHLPRRMKRNVLPSTGNENRQGIDSHRCVNTGTNTSNASSTSRPQTISSQFLPPFFRWGVHPQTLWPSGSECAQMIPPDLPPRINIIAAGLRPLRYRHTVAPRNAESVVESHLPLRKTRRTCPHGSRNQEHTMAQRGFMQYRGWLYRINLNPKFTRTAPSHYAVGSRTHLALILASCAFPSSLASPSLPF